MRIGQKLILGFVGVALLVGVVGLIGYSYVSKIKENLSEIVTGNLPESEASLELIIAFREQREELHHYLLGRKQAREEFAEFGKKFDVWAEKLKEKQDNPGHIEMREKAEKLHSEFETITEEIWKIYDSGDTNGALAKRNETDPMLKESVSILEELKDAEIIEAKNKGEVVEKLTNRALQIFILMFVAAILIALAIGLFISRSISVPITKLKDAATEIGKDKLDTRVVIKSKDEIGFLAAAFNKMAEDLCVSIEKEKKLAAAAAAAAAGEKKRAEELAAVNEELESANEELRQTNEELESATEELRVTNEEARKAKEAAEKKSAELERFNKLAVDRELRMRELKERIEELEAGMGKGGT